MAKTKRPLYMISVNVGSGPAPTRGLIGRSGLEVGEVGVTVAQSGNEPVTQLDVLGI